MSVYSLPEGILYVVSLPTILFLQLEQRDELLKLIHVLLAENMHLLDSNLLEEN